MKKNNGKLKRESSMKGNPPPVDIRAVFYVAIDSEGNKKKVSKIILNARRNKPWCESLMVRFVMCECAGEKIISPSDGWLNILSILVFPEHSLNIYANIWQR